MIDPLWLRFVSGAGRRITELNQRDRRA